MDWIPSVVEIAAGLVLAGLGWFARAMRDIRKEIAQLRDGLDTRLDAAETRLARCESVDAEGAMSRIGALEERVSKLEGAQITHEDLGRVYRTLDGVKDTVSAMGGEIATAVGKLQGALDATRGQVSIVCQHLMERTEK